MYALTPRESLNTVLYSKVALKKLLYPNQCNFEEKNLKKKSYIHKRAIITHGVLLLI